MLITFNSCSEEGPCESIVCQNGGTCEEGTCICPDWYEGTSCEIETREKFFGEYIGTITRDGQTQIGSVTLETYAGNVQRITWDGTEYMELSGTNSVDIPTQNALHIQYGVGTFEGSGSLNGNQLTLDHVETYQSQTVVVNFTGTK